VGREPPLLIRMHWTTAAVIKKGGSLPTGPAARRVRPDTLRLSPPPLHPSHPPTSTNPAPAPSPPPLAVSSVHTCECMLDVSVKVALGGEGLHVQHSKLAQQVADVVVDGGAGADPTPAGGKGGGTTGGGAGEGGGTLRRSGARGVGVRGWCDERWGWVLARRSTGDRADRIRGVMWLWLCL